MKPDKLTAPVSGFRRISGPALALAILVTASALSAIEPGEGNPGVFRLLFETDKIRILEASTEPGQAEGWHSHPHYYAYVAEGGRIRMESPDGKSREIELETGQHVKLDPVARHQGVNIGQTAIRILLVEFKDAALAR